jgi:hypothetical protein
VTGRACGCRDRTVGQAPRDLGRPAETGPPAVAVPGERQQQVPARVQSGRSPPEAFDNLGAAGMDTGQRPLAGDPGRGSQP